MGRNMAQPLDDGESHVGRRKFVREALADQAGKFVLMSQGVKACDYASS